jgi:hypothetical protein
MGYFEEWIEMVKYAESKRPWHIKLWEDYVLPCIVCSIIIIAFLSLGFFIGYYIKH